MAAQQPARASPELRVAPLSPRYRRNYTTPRGTTTINVILPTHDKWRLFTDRPIPSSSSSEVMLAISCDDIKAVDKMLDVVTAHGGTADINAKQDYGWMYSRCLADPDGHVWECMWMDMAAAGEQTPST